MYFALQTEAATKAAFLLERPFSTPLIDLVIASLKACSACLMFKPALKHKKTNQKQVPDHAQVRNRTVQITSPNHFMKYSNSNAMGPKNQGILHFGDVNEESSFRPPMSFILIVALVQIPEWQADPRLMPKTDATQPINKMCLGVRLT